MRQIRETRLALPFSGKLGECAFSSGRYASARSHSLGQHCSRSCRTNSRSAVILALLVLPLSLSLLGCVGTALKGASSATPSSNRQAALTSLTCATTSMTGAGTDTCTVTLNAAAGAGGQPVSLSSNTAAVTVPSSVTAAAGATTANFSATISAVGTTQTATLTASSGSGTETYEISLTAEIATLTLQSTSVPFGDVTDGIPAYQSVTLTSSGTAPVTLSAGSVSGTGYAISGVSLPLTLNPGASAILEIEFDPTTPGNAGGAVTLTSNSSTGTMSTISLSGTGVAPSYEVDLTWDAPADSSDPVVGYNIYRAVNGSSAYQLLNASYDSATSYADVTVASNTSYTYYIESVDAAGNSSIPSNAYSVLVP